MTTDRRIMQLPLEREDMLMLSALAAVGAATVAMNQATQLGDAAREQHLRDTAAQITAQSLNSFLVAPEEFSWERWARLNRVTARLARAAFPETAIEWNGLRTPGESPAAPQCDGDPTP